MPEVKGVAEEKPRSPLLKMVLALVVLALLGGAGYVAREVYLDLQHEMKTHRSSTPQSRAIGALRQLAGEQYRFRERLIAEGKPPLYATLAELRETEFGQDVKRLEADFAFEVQPGGEPRGSRWWAVARPLKPERYNDRVYFNNSDFQLSWALCDDAASSLWPDPKTCAPPVGWTLSGK